MAANDPKAAPAGAPAGSTGVCKDGSYYSGAVKKGEVEMGPVAVALKASKSCGVLRNCKVA